MISEVGKLGRVMGQGMYFRYVSADSWHFVVIVKKKKKKKQRKKLMEL